MHFIPESELILNSRGAVYHLNLLPDELATTVITVGDPDRVALVSSRFDAVEHRSAHREFITHTGRVGNKRISVVSTGIGPDNIDIVLNELDALVNIDLNNRTAKQDLQQLKIIRIGTSGSLQPDIPVDAFVASTYAIGIDNLLHFYTYQAGPEEQALLQAFHQHTGLNDSGTQGYLFKGSTALLSLFDPSFYKGITVTCPGFYGPQGRVLRLGLRHPQLINSLTSFKTGQHRITNFEMETGAIYGLGSLLGHETLSLSAIVANRVHQQFSADGAALVEKLIDETMARIVAIN